MQDSREYKGVFFMSLKKILILFSILTFVIVSCSSFKKQISSNNKKNIKAYILQKTKGSNKNVLGVEGQDYKAGEILVKFKDHATEETITKIIQDLDLEILRIISAPSLFLLKIGSDSTVKDVMERLKQFEEIEYSEPNFIRRQN